MKLGKYSIGTGDRFGLQGNALLEATMLAHQKGVEVTPVWNKSKREHNITNTSPPSVRKEADQAVKELKWSQAYFVDADHITFDTVDEFIPYSNFFTIDVANKINSAASDLEIKDFVLDNKYLIGKHSIEGLSKPLEISENALAQFAKQYLLAIKEAYRIYRKVESGSKERQIVYEISMDEVEHHQSPLDIFLILKTAADYNIPVHTFAPKFIGRFNKGVDYEGDLERFRQEFEQVCSIIEYARIYFFSSRLKLSIHTGSDKYSLYPIMKEIIDKKAQGIHLKTAGTTWLAEAIGLALVGGKAYEFVKEVYSRAVNNYDSLCKPYASVINIDAKQLPSIEEIDAWSNQKFAKSISHDQGNGQYNRHMRQLMHVAFKLASEQKEELLELIQANEDTIYPLVRDNIYENHIRPLFIDKKL